MLPTPNPDKLVCRLQRRAALGPTSLRGCAWAPTMTAPGPTPLSQGARMEGSWHAFADLELGALCLAGGVPGTSSCSISGSMAEGCSGVVAPLPWRVECGLTGSRWELGTEDRKSKEWHAAGQSHPLSGGDQVWDVKKDQVTQLCDPNPEKSRCLRSLDSVIRLQDLPALNSGILCKGVSLGTHEFTVLFSPACAFQPFPSQALHCRGTSHPFLTSPATHSTEADGGRCPVSARGVGPDHSV